MSIRITLDDRLVQEALRYVDAKTLDELVDIALREFIQNRRPKDTRSMRGRIAFYEGYDYKALRSR